MNESCTYVYVNYSISHGIVCLDSIQLFRWKQMRIFRSNVLARRSKFDVVLFQSSYSGEIDVASFEYFFTWNSHRCPIVKNMRKL